MFRAPFKACCRSGQRAQRSTHASSYDRLRDAKDPGDLGVGLLFDNANTQHLTMLKAKLQERIAPSDS